MTCPICTADLERTVLVPAEADGPDLRGFRCPEGHGTFLPSDLYFAWRDRHAAAPTPAASVPGSEEVGDVKRAKLCPQDGRIMRRARVAADGFWLDRCGTCGGIWFDHHEWDAAREADLLAHLPRYFSDAWQRQVDEARLARHSTAALRDAIGPDDLAYVDTFRAWAWGHPERDRIFARLNDRPRD